MIALFFKLFGKRKIIFDYDDAIYLKKFARIRSRLLVWLSNYNVVANHHLAEWAEKYNKNVEIIPTCVSLSLCQSYSRYMRLDNNTFTIGWIGHGVNHVKNLKLLVPVFSKLIEKGVNFRFVVVGSMRYQPIYDLFNSIKGLQVEFIDKLEWSNVESSPKVIQKFDIGVMPLVSDSKSLGKSAFKAIEYMACAVPPVISPVGENNFLIKDGINGFFADNTEEWVEKIEKLYCQPKLCDKIGKIAQKTIKGKYSYNINIPKFINIFKKIDEKN